MSSSNGSRRTGKKHLVVGTSALAVGTLEIKVVTGLCRVWPAAELGSKREAGIPDGYGYVHIVTGTPTALVTALKQAAQSMSPKPTVYDPTDEATVETRLRPFLGLPALALPKVSSIHNPVEYYRQEKLAAVHALAVVEKERDEAMAQWLEECATREALVERLAPLAERDTRLRVIVRRLRERLANTTLALQMSSGRVEVPIPPERWQEEWQGMANSLSDAQEAVRAMTERLAKPHRGRKSHALAQARGELKDLRRSYADLEKLVEERGTTIRQLRDQLDSREAATPVVAKKPRVAQKSLVKAAKPVAKKKVPKFAKLADLADWLLEQRTLDADTLVREAEAHGFPLKQGGIKQAIQYAKNRRDMNRAAGK